LTFDKHELLEAIKNENRFECGKDVCGKEQEGQTPCEYSMDGKTTYKCENKNKSPTPRAKGN